MPNRLIPLHSIPKTTIAIIIDMTQGYKEACRMGKRNWGFPVHNARLDNGNNKTKSKVEKKEVRNLEEEKKKDNHKKRRRKKAK